MSMNNEIWREEERDKADLIISDKRATVRWYRSMLVFMIVVGLISILLFIIYSDNHKMVVNGLLNSAGLEEVTFRPEELFENYDHNFTSHQINDTSGMRVYEVHPVNVTVVSAYINIGAFRKTWSKQERNEHVYIQWMSMFKSLINPLVFYTDSEASIRYVLDIRKGLPTKVIRITRNRTWAFGLLDKIKNCQATQKANLPGHFTPIYVAMTHSKFEAEDNWVPVLSVVTVN